MLKKIAIYTTILVLTICISNAQEKANGFYLDMHVAFNSIGSGFDGETVLVAEDDVFAIPSFDSGLGFGLAAGFRYEYLYTELAFQRTTHDFIWSGIKGDAVHSIWSLNFRGLFLKGSRLQPFVQLGWMPMIPLRVKEGALLVSQEINSDAIFIGSIANFNVGGGMELAIKNKLSARFSVVYKRVRYVSVESSEENVAIKLDENINADDINMTLGIIFVL